MTEKKKSLTYRFIVSLGINISEEDYGDIRLNAAFKN